ncbi:MAG: hypothetical protein NVS1B6_06910 [Steroidobacteraceae bacterium]
MYARYSTDLQRKESIEDQFRVCAQIARRHDFTVVVQFSDEAISGGTIKRPVYQDLLRAARRHDFDVIVAVGSRPTGAVPSPPCLPPGTGSRFAS